MYTWVALVTSFDQKPQIGETKGCGFGPEHTCKLLLSANNTTYFNNETNIELERLKTGKINTR